MKSNVLSYKRCAWSIVLGLASFLLVVPPGYARSCGLGFEANHQPPLSLLEPGELRSVRSGQPIVTITSEFSEDVLLMQGYFYKYKIAWEKLGSPSRLAPATLQREMLNALKGDECYLDANLIRFAEKLVPGRGAPISRPGVSLVWRKDLGRFDTAPGGKSVIDRVLPTARLEAYVYVYNPKVARLVRLFRAIERGDRRTITRLAKKLDRGERPFQLARTYSRQHGKHDALQALLSSGAVFSRDKALIRAIKRGNLSRAREWLSQGANPNFLDGDTKWTALGHATDKDDAAMVELLIARGAHVNLLDNNGMAPLHKAALKGHTAAAKGLIAEGADVDVRDKDGKSPLHWAAANHRLYMAKLLLDRGANVDTKDPFLNTPLHTTARWGESGMAQLLLARGAQLKAKNKSGQTPLDLARWRTEKKNEMVALLKRYGASPKPIGKSITADNPFNVELYRAVDKRNIYAVRKALAQGADPNFDYDKLSPLYLATIRGDMKILQLLIVEGVDINKKTAGVFGNTPLHGAAKFGRITAVELLLAKGANPNAKSNFGNTPLHLAANHKVAEAMELLIAKGAHVNAKNTFGKTPLHYAAVEGGIAEIELLIAHGANINARDENGKTPLKLAKTREIAKLLKRHGGKKK